MAKSFTSYENFIHAIAGAAGSVTAMSVFFPLDTVRLKLQLDEELKTKNIFTIINDIINREGVGALYNGIVPVLQSICASNFVYFYSYHGLRNIFYSNTKEKRIVTDLLLGVVAGAVNVLTTTPFWVVNTRIKMQDERRCLESSYLRSMADGLIKISNKEGISALWCGTVPSLILVINPALHYMIYEFLKRTSIVNGKQLGSIRIFLIGAVAKICSTLLTYPLQVIQAKLRYQGKNANDLNVGLVRYILNIIKSYGIRGLYKGLEAKLYQSVLTTAFMMLCYENIFHFVVKFLSNS